MSTLCLSGDTFTGNHLAQCALVLPLCLELPRFEEMMAERGIIVDHSTINRWVQAYAPELDKRIRPHLRPE